MLTKYRGHRKRWVLCLLLALVLVSCAAHDSQPTRAIDPEPTASYPVTVSRGAPGDFTNLIERAGPAVVNISTTHKVPLTRVPLPRIPEDSPFYEFFRRFLPPEDGPGDYETNVLGSGFVISADGQILTNAHIVASAQDIVVKLTDKREFRAKVIGSDERTDLAVLHIDAKDLPTIPIGDSDALRVGEWVVAIGSPFGFDNSVTAGVVSAIGRQLPDEQYVPFIQSDVAINPGNSGGPLINMKGEVVGINSQIFTESGGYMGISFAIPINLAVKIKDDLLKHGKVSRGRIGVTAQDVTRPLAESFGLSKAGGALVNSVEPGGPAARAGVQAGDIILRVNGREIAGFADLSRAIATMRPGAKAKLQLWRQRAPKEIELTVGELAADVPRVAPKAKHRKTEDLGLELRALTTREQQQLGVRGGVVIESAEGLAARAGLEPGDVILAVNETPVASPKQFKALIEKAVNTVALLVLRDGDQIYVPLRLR